MINQYQALDDAGIDVMPILSELRSKYGYTGDHQTDQTGGKQHLAGFGWGRSNAAPGIEDWGFQHGQQVLVCSDNAPEPVKDCNGVLGGGKKIDRCGVCGGTGKSCPPALCTGKTGSQKVKMAGGKAVTVDCVDGSAYYIWDNDNNRGNDIPRMTQGILTMRERCAAKGLKALRILNYKQVDSLRVLLQRKGYNLRRGSGGGARGMIANSHSEESG